MHRAQVRNGNGAWVGGSSHCGFWLSVAMTVLNLACSASDDSSTGHAGEAGAPAVEVGGFYATPTLFAGAGNVGVSPSSVAGAGSGMTRPSIGADDLAEKGLCQVAIDNCTGAIVDKPSVNCTFVVTDATGTTVYADHAAVQLRGRSSLGFPKKNYGVELRSAAGADNPANLFGMGGEADWVLDGAWADRSFMRNRLCYGVFRDMNPEHWAPQVRYCELTVKGVYNGIYALIEKVKRDDDRIVLPDDDGSGATFVVKQDDDGTLKLSIGAGAKWDVVYPNSTVITTKQTQAIQAWLDKLGSALRSSNPADTLALFDQAAIVDWILLEEFAKNVDAYNLSLFFYRSAGGLARIVPWDMDLSFGQPTISGNSTNDTPQGWVYTRTTLITKLEGNASLRQALGTRWRELRQGVLSEQAISARLDGYAAVLTPEAIARNFALWPIANVDFSIAYKLYTFYDVATYDEEVTHLRSWIQQRLAWLDANIDSYPSQ